MIIPSNTWSLDTLAGDSNPSLEGSDSNYHIKTSNDNLSINFIGKLSTKNGAGLIEELRKAELASLTFKNKFGIEPPPVQLHIQSPGGEVFVGLALHDLIRTLRVPVHTYVEGLVGSAATLVSVAGSKRYIGQHAAMLIHQLSWGVWGTYEAIKDASQNAELMMDQIRAVYNECCRIPKDVLDNAMQHDLFWDAKTCLEYGVVDEIL